MTPQRVVDLASVRSLACGGSCTAALTHDHHLYTWGAWAGGRLGARALANHSPTEARACVAAPANGRALPSPPHRFGQHSKQERELVPSPKHPAPADALPAVAKRSRRSRGRTSCSCACARARFALARVGVRVADSHARRPVSPPHGKKVACGESHMLAVGVSGGLCAWGQNEHGQLGIGASMHGVLEDHVSPIRVPPFGGSDASPRAAYAACGPTFSIVVDSEGRVWTWGAGGSACLAMAMVPCSKGRTRQPRLASARS